MDKEILLAAELAELLRVDTQPIYELARRGHIPVIKVGERQYRFSLQAINRWLENGGNIQHDHQNQNTDQIG